MRKSISIENIDNIDKFVGENFSPEQFIGDCLMEKSFAFTHNEQRLKDVKNILKNKYKLYKN